MGYDVKFFTACSHIVDKKQYDVQQCPRCHGKGYYLDIYFNKSNGEAVLAQGGIKLQQEMLKVIIDEKNRNKFHEQWGSNVHGMFGSKNLSLNKAKLEVIVRMAVEYLKNTQLIEYQEFNNLSPSEILDKILYIEINSLGPTGYRVEVTVSNSVGEIFTQSITI